MREIKFRAWYFGKIWYSDFKIGASGYVNWWNPDLEDYIAIKKGSVELMQFTGIKDKNGKEIYEGDIFKCRKGVVMEVQYCEERAMFIIDFNDGQGYVNFFDEPSENLEIIGNKFENPELLKETTHNKQSMNSSQNSRKATVGEE